MGPGGFFLNGVAKGAIDLAEEKRHLEGDRKKMMWQLQFHSAQDTIKDWRRARQEAEQSASQSYQRRVNFISMGGHPAVADWYEDQGMQLNEKNLDRALNTKVEEISNPNPSQQGAVNGGVPFTKKAAPDISPIETAATGLGMQGDERESFVKPYRDAQPVQTARLSDPSKGYSLQFPDSPQVAKLHQKAEEAVRSQAQAAQVDPNTGQRVPPAVAIQKLQGIYSSVMRNGGVDPSKRMQDIDWNSYLTGNVQTGQQVQKEGRVEGAVVGAGGTPQQGSLAGPGGFGARAADIHTVPDATSPTGTRIHNPQVRTQMHTNDPNLIIQTDNNAPLGSPEGQPRAVQAPPVTGPGRPEQQRAQTSIKNISGQVAQIDRVIASVPGAEAALGLTGKVVETFGGFTEQNLGKIGEAITAQLESTLKIDPGQAEVLRTNLRILEGQLQNVVNGTDSSISLHERAMARAALQGLNTSASLPKMLASILTVREMLTDNIGRDVNTAFNHKLYGLDLSTDNGKAQRLTFLIDTLGLTETLAYRTLLREMGTGIPQRPGNVEPPKELKGQPLPEPKVNEKGQQPAVPTAPEKRGDAQPFTPPGATKSQADTLRKQADAVIPTIPKVEMDDNVNVPRTVDSKSIPKGKDGKPDRFGSPSVTKDAPIDYSDDVIASERFKVAKDSELEVLERFLTDERLKKLVQAEKARRKDTKGGKGDAELKGGGKDDTLKVDTYGDYSVSAQAYKQKMETPKSERAYGFEGKTVGDIIDERRRKSLAERKKKKD